MEVQTNTWNKLEKFLYIPIALATITCYVLFADNQLYGYDVYWHLKIGHDFLFSGLSPWIDRYSFSHFGQGVSTLPIAFEVILAFFVEMLGQENGFYATRIFFYSLCYGTIIVLFKKNSISPTLFTLASLALLLCILTRPLVRPEISSLFLIVLTIGLMIRTSESFTNRNLFLCFLLVVAWSNHHGGIMGYIILSGAFVQRAVDIIQNKDYSTIPRDFGWGIALLMAGFINVTFEHPIINTLSMSENFKLYTIEYKSISKALEEYDVSKTMFFYVCYASFISALAFFLTLKRIGIAFVVFIFIIASANYIRLFSSTLFIVVLIFSIIKHKESKKIHLRRIFKFGVYLLAGLTILSIYPYVQKTAQLNEVYKVKFSQSLINYLASNNPTNEQINIYNSLGHGGFYINHLPDNFKVYIDGRTHILYGPEFFSNYIEMNLDFSADKLSKLAAEENIHYLSFPADWKHLWIAYNAGYKYIAYIGKEIALFSKTEDNMTQAGRDLLLPQCIQNSNLSYLDEIATHPFIEEYTSLYFLKHFSQSTNLNGSNITENEELKTLVKKYLPHLTDMQKRYLAYFFKAKKALEPTIFVFKNINKKKSEDMFNLILTYSDLGNHEAAEDVLIYLNSSHWSYLLGVEQLGKDEIQIMFNLAHLLNERAPSDKLKNFITQLKQYEGAGNMQVGTDYTFEDIDKYCLLFEH